MELLERGVVIMQENLNSKSNAQMAINDYLSLLQIKYDCETVYGLINSLQQDGVTGFGIIPYLTLTVATTLEMLSSNDIKIEIPYSARIKDIRMKLKIFEDGYSKSKRMLLGIDYLQNEIFKNQLTFSFMKNWNIHYNLGIYTNKDKIVIGNTQYNYYLLQDNRFLKKNLDEIATAYETSPNKFNLDKQVGKECYQYAYTCGQFINSIRSGLEQFDIPVTINSNKNHLNFYYADYNTNRKSALLPQGENGKATFLYLLHTLSTINFLLYVLNDYEKDDYGWWLKINYIVYYYSIHKLTNLYEHFVQNKLMTQNISDYLNEIDVKSAKLMNSTFRNCMMHSSLADKNGNSIITSSNFDKSKPLFGLVETCFDGMSYKELKNSVILEMKRISNILSQWLGTQSLCIKPL